MERMLRIADALLITGLVMIALGVSDIILTVVVIGAILIASVTIIIRAFHNEKDNSTRTEKDSSKAGG